MASLAAPASPEPKAFPPPPPHAPPRPPPTPRRRGEKEIRIKITSLPAPSLAPSTTCLCALLPHGLPQLRGAPPLQQRGHHAHCGAQKRKVRSGQGLPGRAPGWVRGLIICLPRPAGPGTPEPRVGGCRPGQKPAPVCSHPRGQGSCGWRPAPQRGWGRPDRGRPGASPPQGREGSPPALPGALETGRRPGRRAAPTRSAARLLKKKWERIR